MSGNETLGHAVGNKINRIQFPLNNMDPPSLCVRDSMSVGKCGDADGPSLEYDDYQHVCLEGQCWRGSVQNNPGSSANPIYTTQSKLKPERKVQMRIGQRRRSSSHSKSLDSVHLNEPPKLRRGLAYLDFEDGDCEPDDGMTTRLTHTTPESGPDDNSVEPTNDAKLNGSIARWRLRMCRVLKQNLFVRLTKREVRDTNESQPVVDTRDSTGSNRLSSVTGFQPEHLPSADLFHQFGFSNEIQTVPNMR
ncbi:uncharacterized protein DEA37_0000077 [Paragonimus westermani]|uniref:Uncharacterized protein n=1 Tax=Paragonimus westermani TaxID=34504 RepID=A0A5J4NJ18_9TREM|nr:uncharacterized protein DEA37_0000077 [Paragonimus westermani]